ncbi:hypothetical protein Holit_00744 [Hollandina sp. SP2]
MKRCILFLSLGVIIVSLAFAEDAAVLPTGTLRVDADAATGFVREGWDARGKKMNAPDAVIIGASLGVAYGFTGWFTAVLDWSPGVADTDLTAIDIGNDGDGAEEIYEGLSDFSLKAQFLIIGNNAPVSSERFRLRLAPGLVIPFPGIGDKDSSGNHTWGAGSEVSFDILFTDRLFVNAKSEFYWFPLDNESKTNNAGELTLEAGPHYSVSIGGAGLAFELPVNWSMSLDNDNNTTTGVLSSYLLSLRPTLALKLTRPFAVDIRIEYTLPLYGKNSYAAHTITIKAPVYFNFAKNKGRE